jgi:NAD(P)-dependent dehydrogenase (short-subunit alcohol dehydrogenase family)
MLKTIVITGASKGIGRATAQRFSAEGYQVINLSRSPCSVEGVQNIAIDLGDQSWVKQHAEQLLQAVGATDQLVLVHNAALMTKESVRDIKAAELAAVLQLNVIAPAQLNTVLLPRMNKGSSIIYISSTLGTKAVADTHAYVISKHAAIGQMRATCQDLAGSQIHTAAVCPGFTETEMLQQHLGDNPQLRAEISATIAHGRLVQPEEIAQTIWFCSQTPAINGAIIDANNGQIER